MSLDLQELATTHWDAIVIGTGMGGATIGHALAAGGEKVLFLEKGENYLRNPLALTGDYLESLAESHPLPGSAEDIALNAGRWPGEIYDVSRDLFCRPILGTGAGGSSALYGMLMERFFASDFEPKRYHQGATDSTLPERWPVSYEEMAPYYARAEQLYRVHSSQPDPLRKDATSALLSPLPLHPATQQFERVMQKKNLHTYSPPFACEWKLDCRFCQAVLCHKECKNDAAKCCLMPAIDQHGAALLTRFSVDRLEADRGSVTAVRGRAHDGSTLRFQGRRVILSAGALQSPLLLLRSRSDLWPNGLANGSDAVGRNLMRHLIDLYIVPSRRISKRSSKPYSLKEISWNDFYLVDGVKYGNYQPFGKLPTGLMAVNEMIFELQQKRPRLAKLATLLRPLGAFMLDALFTRSGCGAPIVEDLPYWDNRVMPMEPSPEGRERISIEYRISTYDQARLKRFRAMVHAALSPYRHLMVPTASKNEMLAHACGTVRFGDDPSTSVLDRDNRAHEVDNLYVVDASFFPSSGGTNPSLTIAANALRVADALLKG